MLILHANWSNHRLAFWAESTETLVRSAGASAVAAADAPAGSGGGEEKAGGTPVPSSNGAVAPGGPGAARRAASHPFAAKPEEIEQALEALFGDEAVAETLVVQLPVCGRLPLPSPAALFEAGVDGPEHAAEGLAPWTVPVLSLPAERVLQALSAIDHDEDESSSLLRRGASLDFWIRAGRFVAELLVAQRFIPTLEQDLGGSLRGHWRLWLSDDDAAQRFARLVRFAPPLVRAVVDGAAGDPWTIVDEMVSDVADAAIRRILLEEGIPEAIEECDALADQHVAWLTSLLGREGRLTLPVSTAVQLMRGVRQWLGRLYDVGQGRAFRLCFELEEPPAQRDESELYAPGRDVTWPLSLHLQSADEPGVRVSAAEVWSFTGEVFSVGGLLLDRPQDLLLGELKRASKLFAPIESALSEAHPIGIDLTTDQAYLFLREVRRVLEESGFGVVVPGWWDRPEARLSARLKVHSADVDFASAGASATHARAAIGLDSIIQYQWQVAIGNHILTREEFERLAQQRSPLVRLHGEWVEIRPRDLAGARTFWEQSDEGEMMLRDALRLAYGSTPERVGLPVLGMDADGWVGQLFGTTAAGADARAMPMLPQPESFVGHLRPYQVKGLSWLAFLDRFGLGACLADDMGLGKTIQLIALLLAEREAARNSAGPHTASAESAVPPTLLVVPTSVLGNWVRELRRFSPSLRAMVHHGVNRAVGKALIEHARAHDIVITTYALVHRDRETLGRVPWWRVCLDEAQNIKNPSAKQSAAIRGLPAQRRIALTGTPVENRLSELWSIMDFLNSGYLGTAHDFRRQFAVGIERYRDQERVGQLRHLIQPFVLRRLKTDPHVIADLPDKLEYKVYCSLTPEQARLYEATVQSMLSQADASEGIQRRGLVLATLVKLKQICNHPSHFLRDAEEGRQGAVTVARSGKAARLIEMLEEVVAEGDSALVFTQFREMGHLLASMVRRELGLEALFLHGGTPIGKREQLIERFQMRDGTCPVFILSLKAGGFGLNLTAANHVFHFDRWWNPAVENQATDRAFRIGQTRAVQVHKFVCSGTLEERIDAMIEQKTELAEHVVGAGEQWLTELSTDQLREVLALRYEDMQSADDLDDSAAEAAAT